MCKFPSLGKFKNPIFNSEILFLDFGPASSLILFLAQPRPTFSLPVRPSRYRTCLFFIAIELVRFHYLSDLAASPTGRRARARPTWPTRPKPRWRICRKAYSLRLCAVWQRHHFSLTSLPCGAHLSAPSPSSPVGRPLPLVASGHPTPPGLQPRDARQGLHSTH
jgi:hypothetical protein